MENDRGGIRDGGLGRTADVKTFVPLFVLAVSALGFSACERKVVVVETVPATPAPEPVAQTKTFETARLSGAIDRYERESTASH